MNYIGIDLGTSSVKGILMSETFKVLATTSYDYPIKLFENGYVEQNPNDWYEKTINVLQDLIKTNNEQIAAISFSGQMHGLVTLDMNNQVIRPAILWNDQRTTNECEYLNQEIGQDKLLKWTGNIALTGFTAPKLLWMAKHEENMFRKIKKILLPKDYLAYRLSGVFATDYSDASGTLYFDVENKKWSQPMLEILQINEKMLPKVYDSCTIIGKLNDETKQLLNINYDISIVIGGGDQAVGAIACSSVEQNNINISLGTSGVVYAPKERYTHSKNGVIHNFCDATGHYHQMGVALASGGSINWWSKQIICNQDYEMQEQLMDKVAPEEPLYYLPYLNGERSPINDSEIRGTFIGLSHNHTQATMTRAIIEGVSFSLYQIYNSLDVNEDDLNVRIIGGGAQNKLWRQIMANIFNKKIDLIEASEGPALGAAYLAFSAYNNVNVKDIAIRNIKVIDSISPNEEREIYNQKYQKWLEIYPVIRKLNLKI